MTVRLSWCVKAATSLDGDDLDSLTDGIEGYMKAQVPVPQAEAMALADLQAEVARGKEELKTLVRQQYPELFAGAPAGKQAAKAAPAAPTALKPLDELAAKLDGAGMSARPLIVGGRRVLRVVSQKAMNSALSIVPDGDGFKVVKDDDMVGGLREAIAARLAEMSTGNVAADIAPATHKDPGEPAEPVTPAVVAEAIKTGVQATDRKPSAMKAELLAEIDQAVQDAPDYPEFQALVKSMGEKEAMATYVGREGGAGLGEKSAPRGYSRPTRTFKVEGDGVFTVNNTVRQLLTFRDKVEKSPGFRDRQPRAGLNERATDTLDRRSTDAAIANMIDEGDFQAALDYAEAKDVDIANVKLSKVLRDRLDKWQKDQESARRLAEYQAAQAEGKPAPGSLAAMMAEQEQAAADPEPDDIPEAGVASQTFDQWVRATYNGNEYKTKYLEEFGGDEKRAMLGAAVSSIDSDRTTADLLKAARIKYHGALLDLPRDSSISLDVWDALDNTMKLEAQRHFYDLDARITRRDQDATKARVEAERIKKAPYEAAFAEVDAEIRRLDKIDGPVTQKQKDLSARRDRLREAIYQIGQGKEPDGRLIRAATPEPAPPTAAQSAAPEAAQSAPAMTGPRRDIAQVNPLRAPYNNGDIVTIGGKDWMVKSDTPGWYLSSDGTWRGEHPTIKGIKSQVELIRAVDEAAQSAAPAAEAGKGKATPAKIEDFGAKLEGARKDYATLLKDAESVDIRTEPLSKSWPEPDYDKLLAGGADPFVVAWVHASRDEVPPKPQTSWKLKGWVASVELLRDTSLKLLDGRISKAELTEKLAAKEFTSLRLAVGGRADLYQAVGHGKSLKGVRLSMGAYGMHNGIAYSPAKIIWTVERDSKATAFGNWPTTFAEGDTREAAIAAFKEKAAGMDTVSKIGAAKPSYVIYRKRGGDGSYIIGKKIGREYIDLKTLPDLKTAREFMANNTAELDAKLEKYRETPYERNAENAPRVGGDHRNGAPVTPEVFAETFGFRGVQFGNYVEQGRRQSDLNQAFDGLMDLAAVLGLPPRALSLNGRLGLAFGARGKGGKNAPAAHYEPGNVVINLTKGGGPGSLAHELWHALDNYFGKESGAGGYGTGNALGDKTRAEMKAAFDVVKRATQQRTLRQRAKELDKRKSKPYWDTPIELSARSFESYVIAKLQDQGAANDYLANVVSKEAWDGSEAARAAATDTARAETYPYPTVDEMPALRDAFDGFFRTVETRTDEAGNVAMFSRAPSIKSALSAAINAKQAFDAFDRKAKVVDDADSYFSLAQKLSDAKGALADELQKQPDDGFVLQGRTPSGRMVIVNASAQNPGQWQITRFDGKDEPWGDSQYRTKESALTDFLREVDLTTLEDMDGTFSRAQATPRGLSLDEAEAIVGAIREANPTAPPMIVLESVDQAPSALRRDIEAAGAANDVEAAYHEGKVYVFAPHLRSMERAMFVIAHHELRHHGMRSLLGKRLSSTLAAMVMGNPKLRAAAQAKMDAGLAADMIQGAEEALADMDVAEIQALKGWPAVLASVRAWLRNLATRLRANGHTTLADAIDPKEWTDADVAGFVARAEAVSKGGKAKFGTDGTVFQRVWHGTPYRGIDKFSTDAIGTGEGAQAYGWGLYFAGRKEVADYYRQALAYKAFEVMPEAKKRGIDLSAGAAGAVVRQTSANPTATNEQIARRVQYESASARSINLATLAGFVGEYRKAGGGQLYEVDIPEDGEMLLWDRPLSEQPAKVRKALEGLRTATTFDEVMRGKSVAELLEWVDTFDRNNSFAEWIENDAPNTTADELRQILRENYSDSDLGAYLASDKFEPSRTGESMYRELTSKLAGGPAVNAMTREQLNDWYEREVGYRPDEDNGSPLPLQELRDLVAGFNNEIVQAGDAPRTASLYLAALGVRGIKYLDGTSRPGTVDDKRAMDLLAKHKNDVDAALDEFMRSVFNTPKAKEGVRAAMRATMERLKDAAYNYVIFSGDDAQIKATMFSRPPTAQEAPVQTLAERRAAADQTKTAAFRKWFGASAVVDKDGKPLVVYHGTDADFATFNVGRGDLGQGIYFASAPDDAASYASPDGRGANVMPVYVSIQNPYYWTKEDRNKSADAVNKAARRAGHDGIIRTWAASDERHFIAFSPEQVKSAIGNRGTFDGSNPDTRFSRAEPARDAPRSLAERRAAAAAAGPQRMSAQDLVNSRGGVFDFNKLGETKQDRIRTVIDASRPGWLGLLTRDQIADVYGAEIPPVKEYDQLTRLMENERSKIAQDADDLYNEWAKLPAEQNDSLARIMLDATVYGVHPDREYTPTTATNDGERQQVHARIAAQLAALSPEARAMYGKVRDYHSALLTKLRTALENRIERQVDAGSARAVALTKIRQAFDSYLGNGPYFPLSRFGDFLVVADRETDGERVVASYATAGEQAAAARMLENDGFTVKLKTAKTYSRETDGAAGKFIGDVLMTLDKLDMSEARVAGNAENLKAKLLDDVNQLFIRALPDLSYRKHFMHRKGTPGFSSDMMRGFASSAFHAASHIARLNHADQMTFALQDAYTAIERAPEGDFNLHSQVLNELTKRHEASLNPNTHPVAAMLNQVGFVMYLGLSPAAGLINMLQTVMVTMPHLGARYGFGKANASLAAALKDIMGAKANAKNGWNAAQSPKLSAEERAMMTQLQEEGVIDLTQAHDLASATGLDTGNVARSKAAFAMARAMKIVGWTFHIPEVMNRQVTALAAYRMEMKKSGDATAAAEAAREAIKRTHFDYSASNRARFMQGNLARVVTQFKQYSQNMTYLLGRALHQSLKGETPEVRSIARRQLAATVGVTFAMAGTLGLPGLGAVGGLMGILIGALSDDEEPWDWKVEVRNVLADEFGKETAEVLAHGIPRALLPWDISNRVSLGDLWWRDNGREGQSPREAFASDMANILGPTAGTALGLYTMADHMAKGNWSKAVESIVPKFLRDPLKAVREGTEGVTSGRGEPLMDLTAAEVTGRALGFAPARASEMYEGKAAVMNAKTAIEERRQVLLGRMAKARLDQDAATVADVGPQIAAFNERNPQFKITMASIAQAVRARRQNRARTEDGILLPRTKDELRELGRFAVTQ